MSVYARALLSPLQKADKVFMPERSIRPYGSWKSPITSDLIVSGSVGLSQPTDGGDIYWIEMRPTEGGRNVIVRRDSAGRYSGCNSSAIQCPDACSRIRRRRLRRSIRVMSISQTSPISVSTLSGRAKSRWLSHRYACGRLALCGCGCRPLPTTIDLRARRPHGRGTRSGQHVWSASSLTTMTADRCWLQGNDFYSSPAPESRWFATRMANLEPSTNALGWD